MELWTVPTISFVVLLEDKLMHKFIYAKWVTIMPKDICPDKFRKKYSSWTMSGWQLTKNVENQKWFSLHSLMYYCYDCFTNSLFVPYKHFNFYRKCCSDWATTSHSWIDTSYTQVNILLSSVVEKVVQNLIIIALKILFETKRKWTKFI